MDKKTILAVFVGLLTAGIGVWLIMTLSTLIYPIDKEAIKEAMKSRETFRTYMLAQPVGSFIAVVFAHGLGILAGLFVGYLIDRRSRQHLFVIGGIMLLMSLINFLSIPHPLWFLFADLGFTLLLVASFIYTRKKA